MPVKCEFCGMEYENDPGKFCDRCGRSITRVDLNDEDEIQYRKCLKCGHRNSMDQNICVNCGDLLHERTSI